MPVALLPFPAACTIGAVGGSSAALTSMARAAAPAAGKRVATAPSPSGNARLMNGLRTLSWVAVGLLAIAVAATIYAVEAQSVSTFELLVLLCCYTALDCVAVYLIVSLRKRERSRQAELERLHRTVHEIAVVEERNRLAREI